MPPCEVSLEGRSLESVVCVHQYMDAVTYKLVPLKLQNYF